MGQDGVELPDAFGQCSRARLKNVSGLDLVNMAVPHSRDLIPVRPRPDRVFVHLGAAPGSNNDFGIERYHAGRIDDSLGGILLSPQFGKDRNASRSFDKLIDPADSTDP